MYKLNITDKYSTGNAYKVALYAWNDGEGAWELATDGIGTATWLKDNINTKFHPQTIEAANEVIDSEVISALDLPHQLQIYVTDIDVLQLPKCAIISVSDLAGNQLSNIAVTYAANSVELDVNAITGYVTLQLGKYIQADYVEGDFTDDAIELDDVYYVLGELQGDNTLAANWESVKYLDGKTIITYALGTAADVSYVLAAATLGTFTNALKRKKLSMKPHGHVSVLDTDGILQNTTYTASGVHTQIAIDPKAGHVMALYSPWMKPVAAVELGRFATIENADEISIAIAQYIAEALSVIPIVSNLAVLDKLTEVATALHFDGAELCTLAQANSLISGITHAVVYDDIAGRDGGAQEGFAWVVDASADATVDAGAALYLYNTNTTQWVKMAEAESMDLVFTVEVADYASLPATGVAKRIYITQDNDRMYRWNGASYSSLGGKERNSIALRVPGTLNTDDTAAMTNIAKHPCVYRGLPATIVSCPSSVMQNVSGASPVSFTVTRTRGVSTVNVFSVNYEPSETEGEPTLDAANVDLLAGDILDINMTTGDGDAAVLLCDVVYDVI